MNSNSFFRAPSEWVKKVVETLEQRLSLKIGTAYRRESKEPAHTLITYQVGESEPVNHTGNDGRKLHEIELFVADVLEALEQKKSPWVKWFERLGGFFDKRFHGPNWREQERKFWEEKLKKQPEL